MKTISLLQPWASLVAFREKRIETRGWAASYRGPLLIHASKGWQRWQAEMTQEAPFWLLFNLGSTPKELLPWNARGVILCQVTLKDCLPVERVRDRISDRERAFGDFSDGRFAWIFDEWVTVFHPPIPAKGNRLLWDFDIERVNHVTADANR